MKREQAKRVALAVLMLDWRGAEMRGAYAVGETLWQESGGQLWFNPFPATAQGETTRASSVFNNWFVKEKRCSKYNSFE